MNKKVLIFIFCFLVACQPEPTDVPFRLELRALQLEIAIIEQDKDLVTLLSEEVSELYKEKVNPESQKLKEFNQLVKILKESNSDETEYTYLQKLKDLIISIPIEISTRDEHLDALMVYGNHLLVATSTASDAMMELYEWNEFESQVNYLKESWILLNDRNPSLELLRYNDEKVIVQKKVYDLLRLAMDDFLYSVEGGDATTYELCSNADVLRERYVDYLKLLTSVTPRDQEEILQ